jgi:hypothetical protein
MPAPSCCPSKARPCDRRNHRLGVELALSESLKRSPAVLKTMFWRRSCRCGEVVYGPISHGHVPCNQLFHDRVFLESRWASSVSAPGLPVLGSSIWVTRRARPCSAVRPHSALGTTMRPASGGTSPPTHCRLPMRRLPSATACGWCARPRTPSSGFRSASRSGNSPAASPGRVCCAPRRTATYSSPKPRLAEFACCGQAKTARRPPRTRSLPAVCLVRSASRSTRPAIPNGSMWAIRIRWSALPIGTAT